MGASGGGSVVCLDRGTLGGGTGEKGTLGRGTGVSETSIGILGRVESTISRGGIGGDVGSRVGTWIDGGSGTWTGGGSGGMARPSISATSRNAFRIEGPKRRGLLAVGCEVGVVRRRCSMSSAVCLR